MKISEDIKKEIEEEYNSWADKQYNGKSKEERQKFDQFFTPPELTIRMLEKFEDIEGPIIDPTGGSGNLLAAAILVGFNPKQVYYNELDEEIFNIGKERLMGLGVPEENFYCSDALSNTFWNALREKGVLQKKSFLDSWGKNLI